ncbi:hypothetical protein I6A84_02450 [Frankia sp. CNm7]|uniref:Uncharacterized protein n=1 Tax=Frankia nepalensis TaxID=1836974 RepID=A0A937RR50_9ACTN|nr:hypothetical protein [Frankia nepalensis]MBL7502009.1 hypothetical protein [Frankia nepalensis]MBL7510315.1 hypothetical protein [Frankia nepalensis]MBL7517015.1 hypothetical protein [Frankia nepalensis]MBL7630446.1 hypothetical protein [Frankia nepalensis]
MNSETAILVEDITTRVQRAIRVGDYPAIVGLHGERTLILSDYDYLTNWVTSLDFEIRAAAKAQVNTTHRWVFAVAQVWHDDGDTIQARPLFTGPLQPGETETIHWMSCDADDGIDYGRVQFARRPDGEPVFDDAEYFACPMDAGNRLPGAAMHRLLTAGIPDLATAIQQRPRMAAINNPG